MFPIILKQLDHQTVEWPFKDLVTQPAWWEYLAELGQGSLGGYMLHAQNQQSIL